MDNKYLGISAIIMDSEKLLLYNSISNNPKESHFSIPLVMFPRVNQSKMKTKSYLGESEFTIGSELIFYEYFYPFGKEDYLFFPLIGTGVSDAIEYFNISFLASVYGGNRFVANLNPSDERIKMENRLGINSSKLILLSDYVATIKDKTIASNYIDDMLNKTFDRLDISIQK